MLSRIMSALPLYSLAVLTTVTTLCVFFANQSYQSQQGFLTSIRDDNTIVVAPPSKPPLSQESIDTAMAMYGIKVPQSAMHPILDTGIEDRGLTTMTGFGRKLEVRIGPAAFESWALLGSTLAHEIEVHCNQNFGYIRLLDFLGMSGTLNAEREAYQHEIQHARRFGLNPIEVKHIRATMDYYYPSSFEKLSAVR